MTRIEDLGVAALGPDEAADCRGGYVGVVQLAIAISTAAAGGFTWGYENLGPVFNRYF